MEKHGNTVINDIMLDKKSCSAERATTHLGDVEGGCWLLFCLWYGQKQSRTQENEVSWHNWEKDGNVFLKSIPLSFHRFCFALTPSTVRLFSFFHHVLCIALANPLLVAHLTLYMRCTGERGGRNQISIGEQSNSDFPSCRSIVGSGTVKAPKD